jgi:hypothetical protein
MPSCLATLRLCDSAGTGLSLLIKAAGANVSVVLFEESRVHLVRCLDLTGSDLAETEGESESDREHREGDVIIALLQQTLAYAEDQLGRAVARVLLCGFGPEADILGRRVEKEFGVAYAGVRSKFGGASQENAGLLGLLERYAA